MAKVTTTPWSHESKMEEKNVNIESIILTKLNDILNKQYTFNAVES